MRLGSIGFALFAGLLGCQSEKGQETVSLETQDDRRSYSLGVDFGHNVQQILEQQGIEVNPDVFAHGINDVLLAKGTQIEQAEIQEILDQFRKELMASQEEQRTVQQADAKQAGEANRQAGEAFLAENKVKEGVKTLPSGLQYRVITEGTGKTPTATNTVLCHYRGRLIDGKEFDSSYSRGEPTEFPVNRVIAGWTEALQLMKEGGKWELYVPSELAYGERGAGRDIGPNATLIFEVELVEVK